MVVSIILMFLKMKKKSSNMDINRLKKIIEKRKNIDAQNDVLTEENHKELLSCLIQNLNETIIYLDNCSLEFFIGFQNYLRI